MYPSMLNALKKQIKGMCVPSCELYVFKNIKQKTAQARRQISSTLMLEQPTRTKETQH